MQSNTPYKPEGYQSVIPYLHVNGAAKLIAFMKDVLTRRRSRSTRVLMARSVMPRSESAIR